MTHSRKSKVRQVIIGYCRKSTETEDKQIRSLDDQESMTKATYSILGDEDKGFPLEIVREAKSAFHPGRPEFNAILRRVDGGEVYAIIVLDPTRLSRNPEDSGALIQRLADGRLPCVITADGKRYSRSDTALLLMLTLEGAISWKDSADKGRRVSVSMTKKAEEGGSIGPASIGYRNAGLVKGAKWIEIDPITGPKILHLFDCAGTGCYSLELLCRESEKLGLRSRPTKQHPDGLPLSKTMLHQMLKNPVYKGMRPYKGKMYKGKHEALVSVDLWERVQVELARRRTGTARPRGIQDESPFKMRGCATCGVCKKYIMSVYVAKGTYIIYECKGRTTSCRNCINQQKLLDELYPKISSLEIEEDTDKLRRGIIDAFKERQGNSHACRAATEKELVEVTSSIGALFLQREEARQMGALDAVDSRIQSLAARKAELQQLLHGMGESYEDVVEQALRCFELQKVALEAVQYAPAIARQAVLKSLASNYFVKDKNLLPDWRSPFLERSENEGRTEWLPRLDSNQ